MTACLRSLFQLFCCYEREIKKVRHRAARNSVLVGAVQHPLADENASHPRNGGNRTSHFSRLQNYLPIEIGKTLRIGIEISPEITARVVHLMSEMIC